MPAGGLLRAHVVHGAGGIARLQLDSGGGGDAEIGDPDRGAPQFADQDVGGFDVPVDQPARVDVRQPGQRRLRPAGHVAGVGGAVADPLGEASAVDVLLNEERAACPLVTRRNDAFGDERDDRGVIQ